MNDSRVDVLLAVRNESSMIAAKLANLAALRGATRLRILIIDGQSSDDTIDRARIAAEKLGLQVEILRSRAGKMPQLNCGLERTTAPWVMVTDADARLAPDTLVELQHAASCSTDVVLVGALAAVDSTYPLEVLHWSLSNRLRRLERARGSAGLVVGPCYLMRRDLLQRFPDDSLADDVYAACRAAEVGGRIALALTSVVELRAAQGPLEFCRHKHRKALGYLREVWRFLPRVGQMRGPAATAFHLRAALLAALPLVALLAMATGLLLSAQSPIAAGLVAAAIVAPVAGVPFPERARALGIVGWLPLVAVIIASALILGPFYKATSAYSLSSPRPGQRII